MTSRTVSLALGIGVAVATNAATVSGPVSGGERGSPFAAVDAVDQGYVTEEYFLEGEATAYELADGTHNEDGRWQTRPAEGKADFKTRLLVVRPEDPAAFNGTVVVFWLNVTAGFELGSPSRGTARLCLGRRVRAEARHRRVSAEPSGAEGLGRGPLRIARSPR